MKKGERGQIRLQTEIFLRTFWFGSVKSSDVALLFGLVRNTATSLLKKTMERFGHKTKIKNPRGKLQIEIEDIDKMFSPEKFLFCLYANQEMAKFAKENGLPSTPNGFWNSPIEIEMLPPEVSGEISTITMACILRASQDKKIVQCNYTSRNQPARSIRFTPLKLIFTGNRWHLRAALRDETANKGFVIRDLVLSRMSDIYITDEHSTNIERNAEKFPSIVEMKFRINPNITEENKNSLREQYNLSMIEDEISIRAPEHLVFYIKSEMLRPSLMNDNKPKWLLVSNKYNKE